MKQNYKFSIIFIGLFLCLNFSFGQGFSHKSNKFINQMRNSSDYRRNIKFADMFEFPADIDIKSEISINPEITISYRSSDITKINNDGYYFSTWGGQYFYYNIPNEAYGQDTLYITITYMEVSAESMVITDINDIECVDEAYDLNIGDALEVDVLRNDKPSSFLDKNTFAIINNVSYGTISIVEAGVLKYINNETTPNYTSDYLTYKIADDDGNYDTARVEFNIHKNSYVSEVFDFLPAPGQFTNTGWADTAAAKQLIGTANGGVSLGGFGGYVVVGFDQPIVDRDQNPYGVDFTVNGNAFGAWGGGSWCEPGAVQVSYDENHNGKPDDEWYELAGANYYLDGTIKNLTMTYYNPKYNTRKTIPYSTDKGFNGAMRTNGFHAQSYYPDPYSFGINPDAISYTGNMINFQLDKSNPGYVRAMRWPAFGYCDNHSNNRFPTKPTNPYFNDENGNASDGFDLKWAVDMNGNSVSLDTVHFVKIYNPSQEDGGWLGEVSTEVMQVSITTPDPNYIPQDYEFHYIGSSQIQVLKGTTLQYNGILFKNGIPQAGTATWISDSTHVANIDNTGLLTAIETGQTTLHFNMKPSVPSDSINLEVVELDAVFVEMVYNTNFSNDTLRIKLGEKEFINVEAAIKGTRSGTSGYGDHNRFVYETYNYFSSNTNVGIIDNGFFTSKSTGTVKVSVQSTHYPELRDTIVVIVEDVPKIVALTDTINLKYYERQGVFENNELFSTGTDATVFMEIINAPGNAFVSEIKSNKFEYSAKENIYDYETIKFRVTAFEQTQEIELIFHTLEPESFDTPKQVLFVNGGQFGNLNSPTNLMSYFLEQDTTIQIDNYLAGATSVQDMLVDGVYAFVSADYYITKYNISTRTAIDSIYTQDLHANFADGKGTEAAGLNNKMVIYQNLLLVTRQNSSSAPEDGYNVRIYNKGDFSFIKKIPVSNQATDIVVVGTKAYVMINGGFAGNTSSMAEIDLEKLELIQEVDLDTKGLGVMQMIAKNNKIYCIRLGDYAGLYNSGITIYDINSQTAEFIDIPNQLYGESSPLAIEPMTNDTLFIKKDMGYVAFNTLTKTVGTDIHFPVPSDYTQDLYHVGRGSVYDSNDNKYYVAYGGWFGNGVGQIYNYKHDSIGDFKRVKESPESMRLSNAMPMNTKPYIVNGAPIKTYNEDKTFSFNFSWNAYKDQEDGRPTAYLENPDKYDWLTLKSRKVQGVYNQEILEPTTFNIPVQIFDVHGAFIIDTMKITINPFDDAPFIANPIADITVDEDATIVAISLANVFSDIDNDDATITKSIISANDESLVSMSITDDMLNVILKDNQSGELQVVLEATSNTLAVTDTFNITVNAVDDAPFVANPIADITVDEDATVADISLANVFDDIDNDNVEITKSIISANDESLVSMSITDNMLNVTLKDNQSGELQVVIEASSNTKIVIDTFNITVNA
ncbi:MAG: hypothetical protein IMY72_07815, partial [Bacteroidetes bacterium]|nr:hypothetical protein [Bacteroidota bacterium]